MQMDYCKFRSKEMKIFATHFPQQNGIYNDEIASIFAESRGYHSVKRVDVDKIDEAMARNMAMYI